MDEFQRAVVLANRVLNRPNADHDDDLAVLSRQFLRSIERDAMLLSWWRREKLAPARNESVVHAERDCWFRRVIAVIDPEGAAEGRYR